MLGALLAVTNAVELARLLLAPAHDAPPLERALRLRDDRRLLPRAASLTLAVDDHPVTRAVEVVGQLGVRVQCGERPAVTGAVEDGHPRLALRVEALRREGVQLACLGLLAVLVVDLQQQFDRGAVYG